MEGTTRRESIVEEEGCHTTEGEMKGQGSRDTQEDEFNATVDVVTCFPKLETENQYMQEVVPPAGTHD